MSYEVIGLKRKGVHNVRGFKPKGTSKFFCLNIKYQTYFNFLGANPSSFLSHMFPHPETSSHKESLNYIGCSVNSEGRGYDYCRFQLLIDHVQVCGSEVTMLKATPIAKFYNTLVQVYINCAADVPLNSEVM